VVLPLGISFYTFQSMSYTIDIYRGHARPSRASSTSPVTSMFPQLVAGPIIRFSEIADQLRHRTSHLREVRARRGLLLARLAKKVLLANPCGFVADAAFDAATAIPLSLDGRRSPTPSRSTSTSAATPTWPSAWG
jgi:alginate O-acetyltransferase complex protein AlgI